jgi:predicted DNA-binding mobile mystery protein A
MTGDQLGRRLKVTPQTIEQFEKSELQGTIEIQTLRKTAEALNCRLVYALVPNEPLEQMVKRRAQDIAERRLVPVVHSMRLENQGPTTERHKEAVEDYIRSVLTDRDLWTE